MRTTYEPGDTLADRYVMLRPIGKGGMGRVYLVEDRTTGRRLALKTLLPEYAANERVIERFRREIRVARSLEHPFIVRIHDAGRHDGVLFYTMDYVAGKSVRVWLGERGRLRFESVVRVLAMVAYALEYAHRTTIHRDLSPDNIMVLPDGAVRLLDFGLAKLTDSQTAFTMLGVTMGKREYNSPEQLRSAAEVDHRTDLYALGVIFREMLTGERPRPGRAPSDTMPGLPEGCHAFYAKATALDPAARFQTAREFRLALMRLYQHSLGGALSGQGPVEGGEGA